MVDIKEDKQVRSISFFDCKTGLGAKASVNKELAQELHKILH